MDYNKTYNIFSWYFDSEGSPVCPAGWDDRYACNEYCPYSHYPPEVNADIYVPSTVEDPYEFADFLKESYSQTLNTVNYHNTEQKLNQEIFDDMKLLDQFVDDMHQFELGLDIEGEDAIPICPFFKETGNCLFEPDCKYQHDEEPSTILKMQKKEAWYPASQNCMCCRGYALNCNKEECQKNQKCTSCDPENLIRLE